ncbi:P-loop NTPase fold protein [Elioraea rosea]|uniref:P-loop NTPase fold protein n=1 Tax=Elioraea rosea TaxID=2492390 RepID=UPI001183FD5F|nr:P-loop NTPase fold protein [Elioraea rosea]
MDPPRSQLPRTLAEARGFDFSQTTRAAIEAAGQVAASLPPRGSGRRAVGLSELIAGMVIVGERERGHSRSAAGSRGIYLIAGALVEALEPLVGQSRIEEVILSLRGTAEDSVALSPLATEALGVARAVAEATVGRTRIDARHLIAALVAPPDQARLAAALRRVWQRDWAISPDSLRAPILAAIERNPESGENILAWRQLLSVPTVAPAAFAADAPAATDDALGRRADARRLAELACLADNAPPLAIGLFGDWGSGKSTFMAMMQAEVERIGAAWKDDAASPFATRVAQIRFNAWSFADANLWASLAVEIFEGLRDEIARIEGTGTAASRRASTLLAEISARTEAARLARKGADEAVREARDTLADIDARLKALDAKLTRPAAALAERAGMILLDRREELTALLRDLGRLGAAEPATIERLAEETLTLAAGGRSGFAMLRRVVKLASRRLAVTLAAAIALAALAAWLVPRGALETAAALVAFTAPFVGRIIEAVNRLSPLLDAVEAEEKAEADLRRERAALAEARDAAAKALAEREATAAKALSGLDAIEKAAATPQALLRFFLNESDELRGYQQEIGLVGRLRRSFQRLDDLMAAQRPTDPRAPRPDLPTLDRIILYIDDLDRLREEQVVKVLEAVGLLLQFRLFVVVVAVDARWLEGALRNFYRGQLGGDGQAGPGDYLEKIFQVPFWLPRLGAGTNDFAGLARVLLPEREASAEEEEPAPAPPTPEPMDGDYVIDPDEVPQPGDERLIETRAAEVRRVTLTKPEAGVLASLMPLAASGPRGAKRFVNLYRLARASRSGEELQRFLGDDSSQSACCALAFLLACETGLDVALLRSLHRAIADQAPDVVVIEAPHALSIDGEPADLLRATLQRAGLFWGTVGRNLTFGDLARFLPEARRYSFHPPSLDRAAAPANPAADQPGRPA